MPVDRPGAVGESSASRRPTVALSSARSRSAATNRPQARWNGNSVVGRRCRDLYKAYLKQLGYPDDPAAQAAILAAAEQTVLAEIARQDCLSAMTAVNVELVVRLENMAARSLRRLKLDKPVSSKRAGPSLDDIKARYSAPAAPATDETGG
jgi:hypothetical protein